MKRAVTSASNIFRRRLCPGSAAMEAPYGEVDSEFSKEGTNLHPLFLTPERPDWLDTEQRQALDMAEFYANEFFATVRRAFSIPEDAEYFDERDASLVLRDFDGTELFPGHADVIRTWPKYRVRGLVDAKFGFMEVDHAADNLQLASYFAMREQQSSAIGTGVAIIQPRNFGPRFTQAMYDPASLQSVVRELAGIVKDSQQPEAPLIPGDKQCHFCKAKSVCEAYKAKFETLQYLEPELAVQSLPAEQLEQLHVIIVRAAKLAPEVREEMRKRIEAGTMPGWKLQNSGDDVTLKDSLGFFDALREYMPTLTAKAYDDCREIQWGKLTDLVQRLLSISEKKAKEFLKTVSVPYATRLPKAMKVVRDKSTRALE